MNFHLATKKRVVPTLAAAVALLLSACGGGGSDGTPTTPAEPAALQLSGTAATGLALANAAVTVKCAVGTGTATTSASGSYTITLPGASLPCVVRVAGNAAGAAVTLHSVVEAGSTTGTLTQAVANVTPLTEIIVAQLTGAVPSALYDGLGAGTTITTAQLAQATAGVLAALKTGTGIDFAAIDPFKAPLVAATAANPAGGNPYDRLLDTLGDKIAPEALPVVVNQVAGGSVPLADVMAGVNGGTLPGCGVALSGKYRSLEYRGATELHTIDFAAKTLTTGNVVETLVPSTTQPCQFQVGGGTIVIGPGGAGAFRSDGEMGYLFPVQSHALAAVAGTWNFIESGLVETNQGEHFFGKMTVAASGAATVCEYDVMGGGASLGACQPDTDETISVQQGTDGGFILNYGAEATRVWAYRSPDGVLNLYGTNNPAGATASNAFRTHFLMTKLSASQLPAVGTVNKYWDLQATYNGATGVLTAPAIAADSNTVTAIDAAAGTLSRTRASDGRVDTVKINTPVEGARYRAAATGISAVYQLPIPGLGLTISLDDTPGHFYVVSVGRP